MVIILTAVCYLRGWLSLRRSSPDLFPPWRLAAFLAGMFSLWIAIGSPLAAFDRLLYPFYGGAPSLFGLTPLEDQIFAGSLMWAFGLFMLLLPAVFITFRLLSPLDPGNQSHNWVMPRRGIGAQPGDASKAKTA